MTLDHLENALDFKATPARFRLRTDQFAIGKYPKWMDHHCNILMNRPIGIHYNFNVRQWAIIN